MDQHTDQWSVLVAQVTHRWGDVDSELLDDTGQLLLQVWSHADLEHLQLDKKHTTTQSETPTSCWKCEMFKMLRQISG